VCSFNSCRAFFLYSTSQSPTPTPRSSVFAAHFKFIIQVPPACSLEKKIIQNSKEQQCRGNGILPSLFECGTLPYFSSRGACSSSDISPLSNHESDTISLDTSFEATIQIQGRTYQQWALEHGTSYGPVDEVVFLSFKNWF